MHGGEFPLHPACSCRVDRWSVTVKLPLGCTLHDGIGGAFTACRCRMDGTGGVDAGKVSCMAQTKGCTLGRGRVSMHWKRFCWRCGVLSVRVCVEKKKENGLDDECREGDRLEMSKDAPLRMAICISVRQRRTSNEGYGNN